MSAVTRWAMWVEEVAHHPLDRIEYLAALECRDAAADDAETFGDEGARRYLER